MGSIIQATQTNQHVARLDLRRIQAFERRSRVFEHFHLMHPGDTLLLTHSHHSMPLLYLLLAEAPGGFTWDYLEQGPKRWRVQIKRVGQTFSANETDARREFH